MNARRLRCWLLALFLAAPGAGGCRWAREVTWDRSARENEPRDQWAASTTSNQDEQDISWLKEARARNEAAFLASHPDVKPPGPR